MAFVRDDEPLPDSVTRLPICTVRSSPSSAVAVVRPSPCGSRRPSSAARYYGCGRHRPCRSSGSRRPSGTPPSRRPRRRSAATLRPCPCLHRVRGRRPVEARQRQLSISIPDAKSGYRYLAPAEGDVARHAAAPPRRPCGVVPSFRAADRLSVVLHHRLQHLQPCRDAQAVTRMRDVPQHAEHRQRHPGRHRTRGWGLAAGLPPVIGHGWQFPALIPPLSYHGQGQEVATPLHISSTSTPAGTFPGHSPGSRPGRRPGSGTHHRPRRGRVWRSTPAVPPARAAEARPRRRNWPRRRARSAAVS